MRVGGGYGDMIVKLLVTKTPQVKCIYLHVVSSMSVAWEGGREGKGREGKGEGRVPLVIGSVKPQGVASSQLEARSVCWIRQVLRQVALTLALRVIRLAGRDAIFSLRLENICIRLLANITTVSFVPREPT